MARKERNWHKDFLEYTMIIANHPNYCGLPEPFKEDGTVKWVVSGNSELGKERAEWWDKKVAEMNMPNRAEVARLIHPKELKGLKPCQICGKKLSIFYFYPNKNSLKKINRISEIEFDIYDKTIVEIFEILHQEVGDSVFNEFRELFKIPEDIEEKKEVFIDYIVENHVLKSDKGKLSPGAMANPPDRFDGFHTYNACCRSKEDTGRHTSNLSRYSQDRRAYEKWAEGNWNLSNRLMGEFQRFSDKRICPSCGNLKTMTADHIGPISLGFTHRPRFNPLCGSCNSGKNNRMTLKDVKSLIDDEKQGEKVISWHSQYLWDSLKYEVKDDKDALKLSKVMREHMHNVLSLLALISSKGNVQFLMKFLNPQYSFFDYKFKNFDPVKLEKLETIKKPLDSKNKRKNAERYIRVSFESLAEYQSKINRKVKVMEDKEINNLTTELFRSLSTKNDEKAYDLLKDIMRKISEKSIKDFHS